MDKLEFIVLNNKRKMSMKRLNYIKNSFLILALLIAFTACNDKSGDEFSVNCDVIFIKKKVGEETVYGTAYFVYSNKSLASVAVTDPNGGGPINLEALDNSSYTFLYEPGENDFSTDFVIPGSYSFDISNTEGETIEATDEQEYSNIGFAEIDSLSFDVNNAGLYIRWNEVSDANAYNVRIYKTTGDVIFSGNLINASTPEYFISDYYTTGTWTEQAVKGQNYILRVQCIKYDSDATNNDYVYNVQEYSVTEQPITWELD